jgi:hypothetical protein
MNKYSITAGSLVARVSMVRNGGDLRLGTVTDKRLDDSGWAYFTVAWHDDAKYEASVAWQNKLRNTSDVGQVEYRADELKIIDQSHLDYSIVGHTEVLYTLKQRVH